MSATDRWATSVNDLVHIFCEGLVALVPIANKAKMPWKEPDNYDDWDSIAGALFGSLVVRSLDETSEWRGFDPLPKFDCRADDYSQCSFITESTQPGALAFVCFETRRSPFDTCLFARLGETGQVLGFEREEFDSVKFLLAGRSSGSIAIIDTVNVLL